jgi:hypothetical protein
MLLPNTLQEQGKSDAKQSITDSKTSIWILAKELGKNPKYWWNERYTWRYNYFGQVQN